MKLLVLISAALSLADALYTPPNDLNSIHEITLKPRGRGDATKKSSKNSRGGPRRNGIEKGKKEWNEDDVRHTRRVLDENEEQSHSNGKVYRLNKKPELGKTGFTYDERTNIARIYYGDDCQRTSDHLTYREDHDPTEAGRAWTPRPDTEEGRRDTERQRTASQRGLPSKEGAVLEEKPAAGVIHHDGEQATVVWDTAKSQQREGIMCKQAYSLVREGGYDRNNVWNGHGGVMFIPNAKKINSHHKPLIGWKVSGWPNPKYYMDNFIKYRAGRSQRSQQSSSQRDSRSLSDSLLIRRGSLQPEGSTTHLKTKRNGVDAIADIQATPATNNGTASDSQADFQLYLDAWDMVQANATDVIWPFIEDMLYGTNSSLVYLAAWSILSDLLYLPISFVGPFSNGWTSMDWDEAQWRNDSTISNATLQAMYNTNDILLTLYSTAWKNSVAALNASGYLEDLTFLSNAIDIRNDTLPSSWTSVEYSENEYQPFANYFLSYNSTVPSSEVFVPTNTTGYALVSGAPVPLASSSSSKASGASISNSTSAQKGWTIVGRGMVQRDGAA